MCMSLCTFTYTRMYVFILVSVSMHIYQCKRRSVHVFSVKENKPEMRNETSPVANIDISLGNVNETPQTKARPECPSGTSLRLGCLVRPPALRRRMAVRDEQKFSPSIRQSAFLMRFYLGV